jgi:sugar phosphate isomerase/epimerase
VAFIQELGPRGAFLHFKDGRVSMEGTFQEAETEDGKVMLSDAKPFLPAGQGQVDLIAASEAAVHTRYVAVELDSYEGDMMQAVKESFDYLTSKGIATGVSREAGQ